MVKETGLTRALGLEYPVIQGPMAAPVTSQITTPELVAAVSNAGGLGTLGAGYMPPAAILEAVKRIRALTEGPFAVNLFVPVPYEADPRLVERSERLLEPYRRELGVGSASPGPRPSGSEDFEGQLAAVIEARVPVFSYTFGSLPGAQVGRLKETGAAVVGTATTVQEGLRLQAEGVDAVVAQGAEAGGHRGTFLGDFGASMVGTMALVPQMADALSVPVIASGGIVDGRGIAAAMCLGAEAVQMGTAFLACEESGAHPAYKAAVLRTTEDATQITRAFSGRPARGIRNRMLLELSEHEDDLPPYPVQNELTKGIRGAAREQGRPEFMSLWAGQAARLARRGSAADVLRGVVEQAEAVLSRTAPAARGADA